MADVAEYKRFVPWCVDSAVTYRAPGGGLVEAELTVGFRLLSARYSSRVELARDGSRVVARARDASLFAHLRNEWTFAPGPAGPRGEPSTWLGFEVDFEFRNALYARASRLFFDEVVLKMVAAFEERARVTLGAWQLRERQVAAAEAERALQVAALAETAAAAAAAAASRASANGSAAAALREHAAGRAPGGGSGGSGGESRGAVLRDAFWV